ncbi:hypothetical protein, conserved [Eimeria praecox]|uniref:Trafficking protein particle complex subunit 13 C-terminal domain-containing protein n=1 Tax=Eimeria praecox TaxID=51316 RepID=U6H3Y6_9EIME|nr:hypothetical protein, conserved [Eimeria praecox]
MAAGDREYLSLKVMRLSQPSWDSNPWPLLSLRDLARDDSDSTLARAEETVNEKWLSSAHALLLPITQGLVCSISHYIASSAEPKSFKKSFRFTAQSPFKVSHRITHLQPPASVALQQTSNLGTLTLQWRTSTGGVGTLSNYELVNAPKPIQPLEMRLVTFPSSVEVDRPFTVELEVINRLQTDLQLMLSVKLSQLEPFVLEGPKQLTLGPLGPMSSKKFSFEVLCLQPGFHSLRGIHVYDSTSRHCTGISPPCHILAF